MSRVVIIIQARMGATRLPGKPLKHVLDKPLLSYLFERLRRTQNSDEIVVATTQHPRDQAIVDLCREEQIPVYRGSEEDVLDRYYQTAKAASADVIVRVTADCPLIDPQIVDEVINYFLTHQVDYASNVLERTYPRGMDVEVFSFAALERAATEADTPDQREHVTPYFYQNPKKFILGGVKGKENHSIFRLTVDTQEDLILISLLIQELYPKKPDFTLNDLLEVLIAHPDWEKINSHIEQKPICNCPED